MGHMIMATSKKNEKVNIRHYAAFHYLKEIQAYCKQELDLTLLANQEGYSRLIKVIEKINELPDEYQSDINYANLYFKYHNKLEKIARKELTDHNLRKTATLLDGLFIKSFENQNKIHDFVFENVIDDGEIETKENLQENISKKTTGRSKIDIRHPDNPLNAFFSSMLGAFDYNPLKRNNVPFLPFEDQKFPTRTCVRIGAQTRGSGYANDTFQRYLLANSRMRSQLTTQNQQGLYDYVYISLMKTEESRQDIKKKGVAKAIDKFVRHSEGSRAAAIECINLAKDYHTAALTLPADGGFFLGNFSMKKGKATDDTQTNMQTLVEQVVHSIKHDRNDFSMSSEVKKALFGQPFDATIVEALLKKAIDEVIPGVKGKALKDINLNGAERNAVLFQFVKWNLSNYILETLNPRAYNMSCKDAIDRGNIHMIWYHMNLLAKQGTPMAKEEFFKLLDSPAMIVKDRALNNNRNLLLNVMKQRLKTDPTFNAQHPWAQDWVAKNMPTLPSVQADDNNKSKITEAAVGKTLTYGFNAQQQSCAKQHSAKIDYAHMDGAIRVPVMVGCI